MIFGYNRAPESAPQFEAFAVQQAIRRIAGIVNSILSGKLNATVEITLTSGATTTTLTDARLTAGTALSFDPLTANAASELAAGTLYVLDADRKNGEHVITHANAGSTDRTFKVLMIG